MTGPEGAPTPPDALGVVDPIRIPDTSPLVRAWNGLPVLAQAFVVLGVLDIAIRAFGVLGLSLFIDLAQPLTALGFLPHLAFVLFPVAVLARRRDAATETPLVLWGAVTLALVELLSGPLFALFPGTSGNLGTWTLLQVFAVAARAGGYVALAIGLASMTRSAPSSSILGSSNIAMWVIAGSALTSILLLLILPAADLGDPSWSSQVQLVNAIGPLPTLAFAYLARVIVRGTVDLRRPIVATYVGTGAVVLAAFLHAATLAVNLLVLVQLAFALSAGPLGPGVTFGIPLIGVGVDVLLVVAFALGLADTSVRMPGAGGTSPLGQADERAQVSWPAPGGAVPVYRPLERPFEADVGEPAKAPGRRSSKQEESPR